MKAQITKPFPCKEKIVWRHQIGVGCYGLFERQGLFSRVINFIENARFLKKIKFKFSFYKICFSNATKLGDGQIRKSLNEIHYYYSTIK